MSYRNVLDVGTLGIPNAQSCQSIVQNVIHPTGISHISGSLKNKEAGQVLVTPDRRKGDTMTLPSQPPQNSIAQDTSELVYAFLESARCKGLSKESLRYYSDFLLKLAKTYPELPQTLEPLEQFIFTFQSSDARRHAAFRAVRAFYNWLEKRYEIPSLMRRMDAPRVKPKEKPALTIEQLKKLLEYPGHRPIVRVLLHFLADTGCRIGEAANLTQDDVFEDSVRVRGKTGERIIPISPMVHNMLTALGPGRIFKYEAHCLSDYVVKAGKEAGVKVNAHDLRRTFATNWRGSDMSLKYIGGWASWKMVEHYSQRRIDKARDDHQIYSPIALINGVQLKPVSNVPVVPPLQPSGSVEHLLKMAEELGATKERVKQLESVNNSRPKYDDLQTILDRYTDYELQVPFAKYLIHALLYHYCKNTLETLERYVENSTIPKCLINSLCAYADGEFDPREPEPDKETYANAVIKEAKQLYSIMANLIRPFILDNQAQALIYKEICGDNAELESIKLIEV